MFQWLLSIFRAFTGRKQVKALPPATPEVSNQITPYEEIISVSEKDLAEDDLKRCFREAARQAAEERAKTEAELLSSGKMQQYIKNTLKYMAQECIKQDSYDFVLISYNNAGVPNQIWGTYMEVFMKIAKEFDISVSLNGEYIKVIKKSVLKAFDNLVPPTPPPDMTAIRELLRTGPYR